MFNLIRRFPDIYRTFGWRDLSRRLVYEVDSRSGQLRRRTAAQSWSDVTPYQGSTGTFFFQKENHRDYPALVRKLNISTDTIVHNANTLLAGKLPYFSSLNYDLKFPPDWHYHPVTKQHFPKDKHWTHIPDLSPELGDIKMVWEMSRFSFVFTLMRAYYATGDAQYAGAFWQAVESWLEDNPPNQGANWKCGQEIALRSLAWYFGYFAFIETNESTKERKIKLLTALAAQAERIEENIRYALSQRNNHGVSEAVGLWTAGLILPEHPRAYVWQRKGKNLLEGLAREQIYPDGAYAQHSFNYQRLMLSLYLWAIRLGDVNQQPLSSQLQRAVFQSATLLYNVQDESTGQLPNYGSNDGALLFPLSENAYEDYRPIIQAIHYLNNQEAIYPQGVQDEMLWWFWGDKALKASSNPLARSNLNAESGGYFTLRGEESFAFTRVANYHHRPHQADNLHVDIWHKGVNIAFDPGTYSYNSPEPWRNGLVDTKVHNTVTVDVYNQMERGSRFLWYNWLKSKVVKKQEGAVQWLEVQHSAYNELSSPVQHRRALMQIADSYICIDHLQSDGTHDYQLTWNLWQHPDSFDETMALLEYKQPWDYRIQLLSNNTINSTDIISAKANETQAWRSTKYAVKEEAYSLVAKLHETTCWLITVFNHESAYFQDGECMVQLTQGRLILELSSESDTMITKLSWQARA